MSWEIVKTYKE